MLCQVPTPLRFTGIGDDRVETGGAHCTPRTAEALRLPEFGEDVAGEDRPDPVDRLEGAAAPIGTREPAQLGFELALFVLDQVDQPQQRLHLRPRGRRQRERFQPAPALAPSAACRARTASPRAAGTPAAAAPSACDRRPAPCAAASCRATAESPPAAATTPAASTSPATRPANARRAGRSSAAAYAH